MEARKALDVQEMKSFDDQPLSYLHFPDIISIGWSSFLDSSFPINLTYSRH